MCVTKEELNKITEKNKNKIIKKSYKIINKTIKRAAKKGYVSCSVNTRAYNCKISTLIILAVCEHYKKLGYETNYDEAFNKIYIQWDTKE